MSAFDKYNMEMLAEPQNVRIKFRKVEIFSHISHFDLHGLCAACLSRPGAGVVHHRALSASENGVRKCRFRWERKASANNLE